MKRADNISHTRGIFTLMDGVSISTQYAWHHSQIIAKNMIQLFPSLYVTCLRHFMLPTTPYSTMLYMLLVLLHRT
jgi:hypothetical protein